MYDSNDLPHGHLLKDVEIAVESGGVVAAANGHSSR